METLSKPFVHNAARNERGTALVLSLFLITVLTVVGTMVLNTSIVEIKMAHNQRISSEVFYAAEAGLERGLLMLIEDFENEGGTAWTNANYAGWAESVTEAAVSGSTTFDPDVRSLDMYISSPDASLRQLTLGGGHAVNLLTFDLYLFRASAAEVYVMSHAYGNGGTAAIEYHLAMDDLSPYNNAIFTGAGVSGHFNGSVNVAGSIYSRGTLDMGANIKITNNYDTGHHPLAPGDDLYDMLPSVTDLDTKVRVKGGDLNINATSAQIGYSGTNNHVEGIYVDGATNVDATGPHYYGTPPNLSSEVPDVPLPHIYDGIREVFDNAGLNLDACIASKSGANDAAIATSIYADWVTGTGCASTLPSSGVVIDAGTVGNKIEQGDGPYNYDDGSGNGFFFDGTTLTIKGNVVILGDLDFGQNNGSDSITYEVYGPSSGGFSQADGGTMFCNGDLGIRGDFSPDPAKGYLKGVTGVDDINSLGVTTTGDITFDGQGPSTIHAGFYYAAGQVNFNKQSKFAGTVIGGLVNFSQVPDVYQVPNLKNYLPPGVPGGQNIIKLVKREWRRVY